MIFAHGPFGALIAFFLRPLYARWGSSRSSLFWLLGAGFLGGIFPDIDLFYYYLIDASSYHRGFITHTPFPYVLGLLICLIALFFTPKRRIPLLGLAWTLGALSHIISDMMSAQIRLFFPFSRVYVGIADFGSNIITNNLLFINFLVEGIIFFLFFCLLIALWVHRKTLRVSFFFFNTLLFTGGVFGLLGVNAHVYHTPHGIHFGDFDADAIPNFEDRDIDGDGVLNIDDLDADGDQKGNVEEMIEGAERFVGVWYDPTNGGLIQIPARFGFLTNADTVRRLYENVGIHLRKEMTADYEQHPEGYATPPADSNFDRNLVNIQVWIAHQGKLEENVDEGRNQIGDILFFESGYVAVVSGFTNTGKEMVLDVHPDRRIEERLLSEVAQWEGKILTRGKVLNASPLFRNEVEDEKGE